MCKICDEYTSGKIDSKFAFILINDEMRVLVDPKKIAHLVKLSETIIAAEVPMPETDEIADKQWTDENYGKD